MEIKIETKKYVLFKTLNLFFRLQFTSRQFFIRTCEFAAIETAQNANCRTKYFNILYLSVKNVRILPNAVPALSRGIENFIFCEQYICFYDDLTPFYESGLISERKLEFHCKLQSYFPLRLTLFTFDLQAKLQGEKSQSLSPNKKTAARRNTRATKKRERMKKGKRKMSTRYAPAFAISA